MAKRTKRRTRLDPNKVIAGSVNLPAHQLIDLIHRINPTGQELSRKDMEEHYRHKCALQNRLISQYKEHIHIVPDPNQTDIIGIHYQGRDACHAPLSELDTDVRAWAQRYMDHHRRDEEASVAPITTGKPERQKRTADMGQPDNKPEELANKSVGDLLESGRKALEAYDFETAQRLFRTASERPERDPSAAVTYLAFLIDTMGDYAAVLDVGETLSRAVRSAPEVRELFGLAAAGSGQTALAESYLKRLTGTRAAEAYRILCTNAVTAQEVGRAEDFLQQARQREVESSEHTRRLSEAIDTLRRQLRQPLEEELKRLFAAGNLDQAGERAQQCLAQWPDSRVARTILNKIEHRQTRDTIQALIDRAREALKRCAYGDALAHFQRALHLGCSAADLGDELLLAQREAEKQNDRARLEDLRQRLSRADPTEGLLAYLRSKPSLRAQIRAELNVPMLAWLEKIDAASSGSKARTAVNGVLALGQAMHALDCGSVEHAANLLSQHEKVLGTLAEARQAWEAIEALQTRARHKAVHQALADARAAMQDNRSEEAHRLLDKLDHSALSEREKKEVGDWLHDLQQLEQQRTLRKRVDSLLSEGQPFAARQVLDRLIDAASSEEKEGLLDERRRLAERIDREWRIPLKLAPDPTHVFQRLDLRRFRENCNSWLLPDRDDIFVAYPVSNVLFVGLVDPGAGTVPHHAVIVTPGQFEAPIESIVHGDQAWLIGAEGNMLSLTLDSWRILRFEPLKHYVSSDEMIEHVLYCPGDRFCWIESREGRGVFHLRVVDLEQGREHRSFSGAHITPTRVIGARGLLLARNEATSTVNLYSSSGKRLYDYSGLTDHLIVDAVMYENSDSLVILSYEFDDEENDFPLIVSVTRQGETSSRYHIQGSCGESICSLAVLEDTRLIFVLHTLSDFGSRLLALKPLSKHIEKVYELTVPVDAVLVGNETGTKVQLVTSEVDGTVQVTPLGRHRPDLAVVRGKHALRIPRLAPPLLCSYGSVASTTALPERIASATDSNLLDWVSKKVDHYTYDAEKLSGLLLGLVNADRKAVISSEVARQLKKGKAAFLWTYATAMLDKECWKEVIGMLRPGLPAPHDWTQHETAHTAHLLGIALYRSGRMEEAQTVWEQVSGFTGLCALEPCIDLAGYFMKTEKAEANTADELSLHGLMKRLEEADQYLEAKDHRAVIQTLDCAVVWMARELQSLTRLVFSLLKRNGETPYDNFIRLMAVSSLLEETDSSSEFTRAQLYFPGEWDQARLDAVAGQARAWWNRRLSRVCQA